MTATLSTLTNNPTQASLDRIINYLHHPIWARTYIAGLVPSNGTDATNDINIATGVCSDLTGDHLMELGTAIGKQLDVAWAEGGTTAAPVGGLDTGAVANTTYHLWLIRNPKSKKVDALFSTSSSAPTMPTGYSRKRRIFSFRRIGALNQVFVAGELYGGGLEIKLTTPVLDVDSTAPTTSRTLHTLGNIPVGFILKAKFTAYHINTGGAASLYLCDPAKADQAPSTTAAPLITMVNSSAGLNAAARMEEYVNTSAQLASRAGSVANNILRISTEGWTDARVA